MQISAIPRPKPNEYQEYYGSYVDAVPAGSVHDLLEAQAADLRRRLQANPGKADYRYAEGKWTVKEVLGHIIDTERVFTYRALTMARGDRQALPGMDQDAFAALARYRERELLSDILPEYLAQRAATRSLFASFDAEALDRTGTASGFEFTVRALCHIVVGHQAHHMKVLRELYGV